MAEVLNEDDLNLVCDALYSVQTKWWEVGLQLNVKPAKLDAIRCDCSSTLRANASSLVTERSPSHLAQYRGSAAPTDCQ